VAWEAVAGEAVARKEELGSQSQGDPHPPPRHKQMRHWALQSHVPLRRGRQTRADQRQTGGTSRRRPCTE